jgi:hypothetical protein
MNNITLTGDFSLYELNLSNPVVTVEELRYNYQTNNLVVNITLTGSNYKHNRDLLPVHFESVLSNEEIEDLVIDALNGRINTPPASNGYGIVIPERFHWVFPIVVSGFTCELNDLNGVKYVEASYLTWQPFLDEFDKNPKSELKSTLYPIFTYAKTNPEIIPLS